VDLRIRVLGDGSIRAELGGGRRRLGCRNKVWGAGKIEADLGVIWGLNSKVKRPPPNLVLVLDETINMKPNGNEKKVLIFYRYIE
jgi:hypothetical protein